MKYPLGESNPTHLSALQQRTYDDSVMPGGAQSGAIADEIGQFSHSAEMRNGTSLLEVIRLLTGMVPEERAALIELLKTLG